MWLADEAIHGGTPSMSAPRRPGRKHKAAPITLPPVSSLPAGERPRVARARLNAVARPLAFDVTGEHGEVTITPKVPERPAADDRLTPQRRRHAVATGIAVVMDSFRTEAGEQTQLKRQRVVSPLDRLWKAGAIDSDQFGAARRYQCDVDMAVMTGPGMSVRYEPRGIDGGGQRFLLPMEAQQDHSRRVVAARAACGPKLAWMLGWIATEPCGWRQAAKERFPTASERFARGEFKRLLLLACNALDGHYRRR